MDADFHTFNLLSTLWPLSGMETPQSGMETPQDEWTSGNPDIKLEPPEEQGSSSKEQPINDDLEVKNKVKRDKGKTKDLEVDPAEEKEAKKQKGREMSATYREKQRYSRGLAFNEMRQWETLCKTINEKISKATSNDPKHPFARFVMPEKNSKPKPRKGGRRGAYFISDPKCLDQTDVRKKIVEFVNIALKSIDLEKNKR